MALTSNTTGSANTACGQSALTSNTTGNANTACGFSSLASNTIGVANTAYGVSSLTANQTGDANTAFGTNSLNATVSGNQNIAIGANAGSSLTSSESNNIYIGNVGVVAESNAIRVGNLGTQTTCFIQGINGATIGASSQVLVNTVGQLGTAVSSQRFKHTINAMGDDSENIYQLNPVTFVYNGDESEAKQYGLIAEQAAEVFPTIVVHDEDGNPYTVQYHILPILLLNELQKLKTELNTLATQVKTLQNSSQN
jgi:hypothetical protein